MNHPAFNLAQKALTRTAYLLIFAAASTTPIARALVTYGTDTPAHSLTIKASISEFLSQSVHPEYQQKPVPCPTVREAIDANFVRGSVDLILLCEALTLGGLDVHVELITTSGYRRALMKTQAGTTDVCAESVWEEDSDFEHTLLSGPVIKRGDFKKGIFTIPGHPLQQTSAAKIDLRDYTGITLRNWHLDWELIQRLTTKVMNAGPQYTLYRMMAAGRADFTIMELSSSNLEGFTYDGITIVPVEGVYVVFDTSRHFLISAKSPHARTLLTAIDKGLAKLHAADKVMPSYEAAGHKSRLPPSWIDISRRSPPLVSQP